MLWAYKVVAFRRVRRALVARSELLQKQRNKRGATPSHARIQFTRMVQQFFFIMFQSMAV